VISGAGSVLGVAVALVVIGWVLNSVGVIPAFAHEAERINQVLDLIRKASNN
jgi:hypothetical protein